MANLNAINEKIFTALKVSELSGVPTLIMSNPGLGKSTTVGMFAKVKGYELELLRGNSTSESEVLGYDVADTSEGSQTTKHLRPSWYTRVLENSAKGKRTLLFLDELTTANEFVQAALLHLVFERTVGPEKLPEDTLIVSAGNYAQNLTNGMNLLPPLMNRFMIVNIEAGVSDLDGFLCKYKGAIAGNKVNLKESIEKMMKAIDKQELALSEDMIDKIGEYFETAVRKTTQSLMTSTKDIDLNIKDLQGIYSDAQGDSKLYGYVTLRTLNYLRDIALASYRCFGKAGITSDNFASMAEGLVGISLSKDPNKSSGSVKTNIVVNNYLQSLRSATNDIAKLGNNKLTEYDNYFEKLIKDKSLETGKVEFLNALINKIGELRSDKQLDGVDRPINEAVVKGICDALKKSAKKMNQSLNIDPDAATPACDQTTVEAVTNAIIIYNSINQCLITLDQLVNDTNLSYDDITKINVLQKTKAEIGKTKFLYNAIKESYVYEGRNADYAKLPEVK